VFVLMAELGVGGGVLSFATATLRSFLEGVAAGGLVVDSTCGGSLGPGSVGKHWLVRAW